jgi:hypothetical protein
MEMSRDPIGKLLGVQPTEHQRDPIMSNYINSWRRTSATSLLASALVPLAADAERRRTGNFDPMRGDRQRCSAVPPPPSTQPPTRLEHHRHGRRTHRPPPRPLHRNQPTTRPESWSGSFDASFDIARAQDFVFHVDQIRTFFLTVLGNGMSLVMNARRREATEDAVTLTVWRDEKAMRDGAYRPGLHREQLDRYKSE